MPSSENEGGVFYTTKRYADGAGNADEIDFR